jgi:hypothetical protein
MNCIRPYYPCFTVFFLLDIRDIVIIYSFDLGYKYDSREIGLIVTFQFYFIFSIVEMSHELNF